MRLQGSRKAPMLHITSDYALLENGMRPNSRRDPRDSPRRLGVHDCFPYQLYQSQSNPRLLDGIRIEAFKMLGRYRRMLVLVVMEAGGVVPKLRMILRGFHVWEPLYKSGPGRSLFMESGPTLQALEALGSMEIINPAIFSPQNIDLPA